METFAVMTGEETWEVVECIFSHRHFVETLDQLLSVNPRAKQRQKKAHIRTHSKKSRQRQKSTYDQIQNK